MITYHLAEPCHADWNAMEVRPGGRHCASCDREVVDLTGLSSATAATVLDAAADQLANGQRVCLRGRTDERGRIAVRPGRTKRLLTNAFASLLAFAAVDGEAQAVETTPIAPLTHPPVPGGICAIASVTDPVAGITYTAKLGSRAIIATRTETRTQPSKTVWSIELPEQAPVRALALKDGDLVVTISDGGTRRLDPATGALRTDPPARGR